MVSQEGPAADLASQADQAAPDVSESGVPAVEHVNKMKKDEAVQLQAALEQRLASAEGPQTPEEVVGLTKVLKAVQRRIRQLNQVTAKGRRTKWKKAFDAKLAEIEELQSRVSELRQGGFLLRAEEAQLTAQEEGLVAVLSQLTKDQDKLEGAGADLQAAEVLLKDSQRDGLRDINDEEASQLGQEETTYNALLAKLERRHKAIVENIKAEAASARRALQLDVANEAQDVVERKDVHGKAEAAHANKVEQVTLRQTSLAQQRADLEAKRIANFEDFNAARAALEQAGKDMERLQGKRPSAPAPVREGIDPDATLAPEADGLKKDRREEEMAERTLALDITLETMPRKLGQLAIGLNETQSAMDRDSYYEFGQDRPARVTPKEDFRVALGEQGHTKTLQKLNQEIQDAERKAGELDPQVLGREEVERYQSAVEKLKKELEKETVFLDALKIWLEDQSGRVPQRSGTPPTPPPAPTAPTADSHGLTLGAPDDDDDGTSADASSIDLDDATGEDLPTAPPRLPILTPDEVQQIRADLSSSEVAIREDALKGLNNKEPSPEWVEILDLASLHHDPEIRHQVPRYAARLATFLSGDALSHDRTLNAAGLKFFREFPNDENPEVANQATNYLDGLVLAEHFLPREVKEVADIVALYLKKHSNKRGVDDRGIERGNVLGLVRDLIGEIEEIHQAINESRPPRVITAHEEKTIKRIREFLYRLFAAVLNPLARADYPDTVINAILGFLEEAPYCLAHREVCNLPLSNEERIKIMTGRTIDIVNDLRARIEDGVDIEEIRDEFRDRASGLRTEMLWFTWQNSTPQEDQAIEALNTALRLLDQRLWSSTDSSIELGDIEVLLTETTAPNDSVLEQEISDNLDVLLGERGLPYTEASFKLLKDVIIKTPEGEDIVIEERMKEGIRYEVGWLNDKAGPTLETVNKRIKELRNPSAELRQRVKEAEEKFEALRNMYDEDLSLFL